MSQPKGNCKDVAAVMGNKGGVEHDNIKRQDKMKLTFYFGAEASASKE